MITQQYRPKTFKEVAGHELVIKTLRCIVKNPEASPKSIILQGEFGTGKTTCARVLARALNCSNKTPDGDACGVCEWCKSNLDSSMFYDEYDSAMIGSVDAIRSLRDSFYFNSNTGYKIIVIDECHLMTKQAQSALLKVLEDIKDNIFFIFCTTDIDNVLSTIRSRSLELRFNLVDENTIKYNLCYILECRGLLSRIGLNDNGNPIYELEGLKKHIKAIDVISKRCAGHMRNAHMFLDQYLLLGDEFVKVVPDARDLLLKFFMVQAINNKERGQEILLEMLRFSMVNLKVDYEQMVLDVIKAFVLDNKEDKLVNTFLQMFEGVPYVMLSIINDPNNYKMFGSDKQFQAMVYVVANRLSGLLKIRS